MRISLPNLIIFLLLISGGGLAVYDGGETWYGAAGVCLLSIAFAAVVVIRRLRTAMQSGVPDFLTVFLAFQVLNKTMTIVSLAAGDLYMAAYEAEDLVAPVYAYRAECVLLVAMVLFSTGWLVFEKFAPPALLRPRQIYSSTQLIRFYLIVTVFTLGLQIVSLPFSLGVLPTLMQYSALAAVGVLLASNTPWGLGGSMAWLAILLLAPPLYLAMMSGSKEALILVALPILIAGLAKSIARIAIVLVPIAGLMLALGIPLSQEMRAANWESTGRSEGIGASEGMSRVFDRYLEGDVTDVILATAVKFCHRASSAQSGGAVMRIVDESGLIGGEPLKSLPAIFIPRVIWPDKPVFQPGAWFTWYRGHADSPETATTSTATMLGTEIYWMFGVLGLSLMLLLGLLYSAVWRYLREVSNLGLMGFAGMYAFLGGAIRFEETHTVYAISGPIAFLFYSYVLALAERTLRGAPATVGGSR